MNQPEEERLLPKHIAIILDGNGRWARRRNLPRTLGHREGAKAVEPIVHHCAALGITSLTLYAFSTENWKRPAEEVQSIMKLMREVIASSARFHKENIRLRILGDVAALSEDLQQAILKTEQDSASNTGLCLNIAINYGARQEILHAARCFATEVAEGRASVQELTEERFGNLLSTAGQPEVDLLIRPSGEQRLSNFLLWQCAYAEFVFCSILWPDFTPADLDAALAEYDRRNRRFGGI